MRIKGRVMRRERCEVIIMSDDKGWGDGGDEVRRAKSVRWKNYQESHLRSYW